MVTFFFKGVLEGSKTLCSFNGIMSLFHDVPAFLFLEIGDIWK